MKPGEKQKERARGAARYAVKKGILTRPDACPRCGSTENRIDAHHHKGYDDAHRLDVVFLCTVCHGKDHRIDA